MTQNKSKKNILISILAVCFVLAFFVVRVFSLPSTSSQLASSPSIPPSQTKIEAVFRCANKKSITATFYPENDTHVDIRLSDGRILSLAHVLSGSGARYANSDESIVFWNKGNTAFMTENGVTTYNNCALPK